MADVCGLQMGELCVLFHGCGIVVAWGCFFFLHFAVLVVDVDVVGSLWILGPRRGGMCHVV